MSVVMVLRVDLVALTAQADERKVAESRAVAEPEAGVISATKALRK